MSIPVDSFLFKFQPVRFAREGLAFNLLQQGTTSMKISYPAKIQEDGDRFMVSFRDVPGALTGGASYAQALALAPDCLRTALEDCVGYQYPATSDPLDDELMITAEVIAPRSFENKEQPPTAIPHRPGVEVRSGVYTTNDPKYDFDTNVKRMVSASSGKVIPDDIVVFSVRSDDLVAEECIEAYQRRATNLGCPDYHITTISTVLDRFMAFKRSNPGRMKLAQTKPRTESEQAKIATP